MPSLSKVRAVAIRLDCNNNIRTFALAANEYRADYKHWPNTEIKYWGEYYVGVQPTDQKRISPWMCKNPDITIRDVGGICYKYPYSNNEYRTLDLEVRNIPIILEHFTHKGQKEFFGYMDGSVK